MLKIFSALLFLFPNLALATVSVLDFKSADCSLSLGDKILKAERNEFMTLAMDKDFARFLQIQFGNQKQKIQYQLLIENDSKNARSFVVLQNLMVGEEESSKEYSTLEVSAVQAYQGDYVVTCFPELDTSKKNDSKKED